MPQEGENRAVHIPPSSLSLHFSRTGWLCVQQHSENLFPSISPNNPWQWASQHSKELHDEPLSLVCFVQHNIDTAILCYIKIHVHIAYLASLDLKSQSSSFNQLKQKKRCWFREGCTKQDKNISRKQIWLQISRNITSQIKFKHEPNRSYCTERKKAAKFSNTLSNKVDFTFPNSPSKFFALPCVETNNFSALLGKTALSFLSNSTNLLRLFSYWPGKLKIFIQPRLFQSATHRAVQASRYQKDRQA